MKLLWQPSFSTSRKPVKRSFARRTERFTNAAGQQLFEFIPEYPKGKHEERSLASSKSPEYPRVHLADLRAGVDGDHGVDERSVEILGLPHDTDTSCMSISTTVPPYIAAHSDTGVVQVQEESTSEEPVLEVQWSQATLPDSEACDEVLGLSPLERPITLTHWDSSEPAPCSAIPWSVTYGCIVRKFEPILQRCIFFHSTVMHLHQLTIQRQ